MISFNRLLILVSFLTISLSSYYPQSPIIDSLEQELVKHSLEDSDKVDLLHKLAHHYRGQDINIAEEKCNEAFLLATELNYQEGLAKNSLVQSKIHLSKSEFQEANEDALQSLVLYEKINDTDFDAIISVYNTLGMIGNYQNNSDTALYYFRKGMFIAKENQQLKGQSKMTNNIGITFYLIGELDSAVVYYQKAFQIDKEVGDNNKTSSTLNNIAVIYSIQGRYSEALEIHSQVLELRKKENQNNKIASTLHNMGTLYSEMEQYEKALQYLEDALVIFKELEDLHNTAKVMNGIGNALVELKQYDEGITHLKESLALNTKINNNEGLIVNHNSLGSVWIKTKQYELALEHFSSSLELSIANGDKRNIGHAHINLGQTYFLLNNYSKALDHALEGKQMAEDLKILGSQVDANGILSEIYEVTGNYKAAFESHKQFKILNDSLFNKENVEKITQLEYEFKYKNKLETAKNKELKLSEKVKVTTLNLEKTQRNLLLGIILFLSVLVLLGGIIFYLRFKNVKERTQNIITEQKLLRSQMTPHFIFNALSVLQGFILNKEEKRAVTYLSKFSKLLRLTLENSREQMVSIGQELQAIENYLELQNIEASKPYHYSIEVDSTIDKEFLKIPPMLIQPFIENALEHGFSNEEEERHIDLQLTFTNGDLTCIVKDNGVGIDAQKESKKSHKKSLSTAITSERLELLSKSTKSKGSMLIEDRKKFNEQGTLVTLVIPYEMDRLQG